MAGGSDQGALVLDGFGKIRSCGAMAARLFGRCVGDVAGRSIAEFIPGFSLSDGSLSYSTRFLAHLCAAGGWRRFAATDTRGREFEVELALSRVSGEGPDVFLLNLRGIEGEDA